MKKTQLQSLTKSLAAHSWQLLTQVFAVEATPLPPIYYFLSPDSRGSLRGRSLYEIDLVHRQQFLGEGITLKFPPTAYVSNLAQVIEETAHLFALTHQESTAQTLENARWGGPALELWSMSLHEAFGKFATHLLTGKNETFEKQDRWSRTVKSPEDIWEASHREGYFLGCELAKAYWDDRIQLSDLRKWFRMNWYSHRSPVALSFLYRLLKQSAPQSQFTKFFQIRSK